MTVTAPVPTPRPPTAPASLADLGWDAGWEAAFAPHAAQGLHPARVVAAHRDLWVVALPSGDREAVVSGRLRHDALGPGDLPAAGDWVAVSGAGTGDADTWTTVIGAVLPRRTAFRRSAGEERLAGNLSAEQVLAANVDVAFVVAGLDGDFNLRRLERYLAVAWSGGTTPVILLNKADMAADLDGLRVAAEAVAPGVEVRTMSALTGDGVAGLAADHLPPGRTAVVLGLVGRRQVHARQRARGARAPAHRRRPRGRRQGPPHDHDPRAGPAPGRRDPHRHPGDPLPGRRRGRGRHGHHLRRHHRARGRAAASATAATRRSRAARSGPRWRTGAWAPTAFESHRKLEKEAAHAARKGDRLAQDAESRKWRAIHASVKQHMRQQVRQRPMTATPTTMPGTTTPTSLGPPLAPAGPGVTYRRWRGMGDIEGMAAANARLRGHVGLLEPIDVDGMRHRYTHLVNSDPTTDCILCPARRPASRGYARDGVARPRRWRPDPRRDPSVEPAAWGLGHRRHAAPVG